MKRRVVNRWASGDGQGQGYSPGGKLLLRPGPEPPVELRRRRRPVRDELRPESENSRSENPSSRCRNGFFTPRGEVGECEVGECDGEAEEALASVWMTCTFWRPVGST